MSIVLSFPRSAWERKCATFRVAAGSHTGRDAERPDVRSHVERGNESGFLAAIVLAAFPLVACAGDTIVPLTVSPMAVPNPVLKYQLLPEVREMNAGNPAQWYIRCFAEQRNFFFTKYSADQRARYLSLPLAELRAEKIRRYGGHALTQADWAARLDALDWQVLERVQTDGLDIRLPELEPLRILATALKVRFRIEVSGGHFEDAIHTAKTMFAFARHLGEHPTHTANEIGLFAAQLTLDALEEMVQQPDCPNLYWALTDLPVPLVDLRKGFQGERTLRASELRSIRDDAAMTEEELEKVVSRLSGVMGFTRAQAGKPYPSLRAGLAARTKDAEKVRVLRDRLLEAKRHALVRRSRNEATARAFVNNVLELTSATDVIRKMPPLQLILLDEKQKVEALCDERMKLLGLATWQIDKLGGDELERGSYGLLSDLAPHVIKTRREQARLEQRIALLRHVEALRLYAARHKGKHPDTLSAIAVPLPNDPLTGKPFVYEVEKATAHLRGDTSQPGEGKAACAARYDVTLRK